MKRKAGKSKRRSSNGRVRGLTPKQMLFATFIGNMNFETLSDAAIRAGYSRKSAGKIASKLIRNPLVREEARRRMKQWCPELLNIYGLAEW